jgi:hypothetical protein
VCSKRIGVLVDIALGVGWVALFDNANVVVRPSCVFVRWDGGLVCVHGCLVVVLCESTIRLIYRGTHVGVPMHTLHDGFRAAAMCVGGG